MHTDSLGSISSVKKLTYRDFLKFPDDGKRHELIDGVHVVTPCPATPHQRVLGNLYFLVRGHIETHGGGEAFLAPFDVVFSTFDVVEPDLLFISDARREILTDKNVQGSPDLVIEILSPSTRRRDEGIKLKLYERFDVLDYWVIDPQAEAVRVYRRRGLQLERMVELTRDAGESVSTPLLPGLRVRLAKLFA